MRVARSPDSDPTSDLSSCFLLWQASPRITIVTAFLNSSPTLRTYLLGDEGSLRPSVSTRRTLESERSQSHDREIYRGKGKWKNKKKKVFKNCTIWTSLCQQLFLPVTLGTSGVSDIYLLLQCHHFVY